MLWFLLYALGWDLNYHPFSSWFKVGLSPVVLSFFHLVCPLALLATETGLAGCCFSLTGSSFGFAFLICGFFYLWLFLSDFPSLRCKRAAISAKYLLQSKSILKATTKVQFIDPSKIHNSKCSVYFFKPYIFYHGYKNNELF